MTISPNVAMNPGDAYMNILQRVQACVQFSQEGNVRCMSDDVGDLGAQ